MNVKFKFDFKELLKEHCKEIIVVLVYLVAFLGLIAGINSIKEQKSDKEFDMNLAKIKYDNVKNSNLSEEFLATEKESVEKELEEVKQKLPIGLKNADVNLMLAEIMQDTGNLFNLANCNISESKTKSGYSAYEVRISSINGTYSQIKNLLNYIKDFRVKVTITQLDFNKELTNVQGSLTLVFYGEKQLEEEV